MTITLFIHEPLCKDTDLRSFFIAYDFIVNAKEASGVAKNYLAQV